MKIRPYQNVMQITLLYFGAVKSAAAIDDETRSGRRETKGQCLKKKREYCLEDEWVVNRRPPHGVASGVDDKPLLSIINSKLMASHQSAVEPVVVIVASNPMEPQSLISIGDRVAVIPGRAQQSSAGQPAGCRMDGQ